MPRHPRLFVLRATFHVCCRVAHGEFVFDCDEEAIEFIEVIRRVRENPDARHLTANLSPGNAES